MEGRTHEALRTVSANRFVAAIGSPSCRIHSVCVSTAVVCGKGAEMMETELYFARLLDRSTVPVQLQSASESFLDSVRHRRHLSEYFARRRAHDEFDNG